MILFYIVSYDVWFYLSHIILHTYFRKIHAIHHSTLSHKMTYPDTYAGHHMESVFQGLGYLFPLMFFSVNMFNLFVSFVFINLRVWQDTTIDLYGLSENIIYFITNIRRTTLENIGWTDCVGQATHM